MVLLFFYLHCEQPLQNVLVSFCHLPSGYCAFFWIAELFRLVIRFSGLSLHQMGYTGQRNVYAARAHFEGHMHLLRPVYPIWCKLRTRQRLYRIVYLLKLSRTLFVVLLQNVKIN